MGCLLLVLDGLLLMLTLILYAIVSDLLSQPIELGLERILPRPLVLLLWRFPGTIVHESSHAVFAVLFSHEVEDFRCFLWADEKGTLGYVKHSWDDRSLYQRVGNIFIGTGPAIGGPLFCWVCYRLSLCSPQPALQILCYWLLLAGGSGFRLSNADLASTLRAGRSGFAFYLVVYTLLGVLVGQTPSAAFFALLYRLLLARAIIALMFVGMLLCCCGCREAGPSVLLVGWGPAQVLIAFAQPPLFVWWTRAEARHAFVAKGSSFSLSSSLFSLVLQFLALLLVVCLTWALLLRTQKYKIWPERIGPDPSFPLPVFLLPLLLFFSVLLFAYVFLYSSSFLAYLSLLGWAIQISQHPSSLNAEESTFSGHNVAAKYRALTLACWLGPLLGLWHHCRQLLVTTATVDSSSYIVHLVNSDSYSSAGYSDVVTACVWSLLLGCVCVLALVPPVQVVLTEGKDEYD
eukprot:gb/GEZN01005434.1/.p1 GENE.gb/GEZN01005434.1/~~gb/GEZN01005434.1/.p1  ORF type:complete len:460 (-),score=46.76 gb/GEZN01005434.1/:319-1698(-)